MGKKSKDLIVVGFALFAMFLGAGNLIFPPTLGALAGDHWLSTMIGFMVTGIGMPLLGIIATSKAGGRIENLAGKVGVSFATILGFLIMLAIGPLLAIPRTAATTFEIGLKPLMPTMSPVVSSIIFFGITLFFVLNPNGVIDKIGTILTPILILILSSIIIKAIVTPIGVPVPTGQDQNFLRGFKEGYQTMDALASVIMAGIVIENIRRRGYTEKSANIKMSVFAGIVAALGLALVYGGLVYMGATGNGIYGTELSRIELLMSLVNHLFGGFGKLALGLAVSLACLTTAIGLTATAGDFFSNLTGGKLNYKVVVIVTCTFSAFFAIRGVDSLIEFAVPILTILYPITIVLIIMNLLDRFIIHKWAYKGAVLGAFCISFVQGLAAAEKNINKLFSWASATFQNITPLSVNFDTTLEVLKKLPLSKQGFEWAIPALALGIAFAVAEFIVKRYKKEK